MILFGKYCGQTYLNRTVIWILCGVRIARNGGNYLKGSDDLIGYWFTTTDRDLDAIALYKRHYSARHYRDGRANLRSKGFLGPGENMVLITARVNALFCWVFSKIGHKNGQKGVCCTIFRNESPILSSELIREAVELAQKRWPSKRLFTYINGKKIRSTNPGYCFQKAGWEKVGKTKNGLYIFERS